MTIQQDAIEALAQSDITCLRALEHGTQIPDDWKDYRASLREIASGASPGPLPEMPDYPQIAPPFIE